ncbi:hypothetical protein LTS17_011660 [Exophiala oligosperma]
MHKYSLKAATVAAVSFPFSVGAQGLGRFQKFNTSDVIVPVLEVQKFGPTEGGFLFLNTQTNTSTVPAIFTDDGSLVWCDDQFEHSTSVWPIGPLRPQKVRNQTLLFNWVGPVYNEGLGWGTIQVFDDSYTNIYNVTLEESFQTFDHIKHSSYMDFHESEVTDNQTILVTAVNITTADMTAVGGPGDGYVIDSQFYEIEIPSNKVVFRWSSVEHVDQIPLNHSLLPLESLISGNGTSFEHPWGYFHINSVKKYGNDYLISSRLLCSLFYIDAGGNVLWTLSNGGDFRLGENTRFCYQHDARIAYQDADRMTITLHDNGDTEYDNNTLTRGLSLDLDMSTKLVTVNRSLSNPTGPVFAVSQGSYQDLSDGHVLLGHGAVPVVEEYDADGNIAMLITFGTYYLQQSYRAYRYPWTGRPVTPPRVVAFEGEGTDVYMSWNGATDLAEWSVYCGQPNGGGFSKQATVRWAGFETAVNIPQKCQSVQAEAVTTSGQRTNSSIVTVGKFGL